MKRALLVAGSGGHAEQARILLKKISGKFDISLMLESKDRITQRLLKEYKQYKGTEIRGKKENLIITFARVIICTLQSIIIYLKSRPDVIVSTGPGMAIPIILIGKLFNKKIIYIESWSRVTTSSMAGRIAYKYADLFFVQWPELKKQYPKAIYAGRFFPD